MRISVVIPTLGRRDRLPLALDALERQTVDPGAFEVIVVGDLPDDDAHVVDEVLAAKPRPYATKALRSPGRGASAARNAGWRAAETPLVLFMGDDILAVPAFLEEHLDWHARRGGDLVAVLGHVRWAPKVRVTPFMRWLDRGIQFDYPAIEGEEASWFNFYTANISLPRAALERVGGFDEDRFPFLYEDLDLGYRLDALGLRMLYNRQAIGDHLHPTDVDGYRGRMAATATAERNWVAHRPEMPAYFHGKMTEAAALPPARGTGRMLLRWVTPDTPLLGRRAWLSADVYFRQQLAPAFLEQWERDEAAGQPEAPASLAPRR